MQVKFDFNPLNGDARIFELAERRVVVTPDESLLGETKYPLWCENPVEYNAIFPVARPDLRGSLGICRRCGKGTVYRIEYSEKSMDNVLRLSGKELPKFEVRCNYCKW